MLNYFLILKEHGEFTVRHSAVINFEHANIDLWTFASLDLARGKVPVGYIRQEPTDTDDPNLIERWKEM